LYLGAFAAAWAGFTFRLPPVLHTVVCLLFGAVFGGIWGLIPGWLRAKRGANEFVTTMMLSYVAIYLTSWLVAPGGPYHGTQWANQTVRIATSAQFPRLLRGAQLSWGIVVGVLIWYLLFRIPRGYELRAVGQNPLAAEYGGINVARNMILALTLAGALAGLGGAAEILGTHRRFIENDRARTSHRSHLCSGAHGGTSGRGDGHRPGRGGPCRLSGRHPGPGDLLRGGPRAHQVLPQACVKEGKTWR